MAVPSSVTLTFIVAALIVSVIAGDNNGVFSPCTDTTVQLHDGFTLGLAFSGYKSFFSGTNTSVQLSPCDKRLSLSGSNSQVAVFRPKVDEISLLTVNSSSLSPESYGDGYMVAFAGSKYAARSTPVFVGNSSYIVNSFTLVLEFEKGVLNTIHWKKDGCASCKGNSNLVCLNGEDCGLGIGNCTRNGGKVDCSPGIQVAFSGGGCTTSGGGCTISGGGGGGISAVSEVGVLIGGGGGGGIAAVSEVGVLIGGGGGGGIAADCEVGVLIGGKRIFCRLIAFSFISENQMRSSTSSMLSSSIFLPWVICCISMLARISLFLFSRLATCSRSLATLSVMNFSWSTFFTACSIFGILSYLDKSSMAFSFDGQTCGSASFGLKMTRQPLIPHNVVISSIFFIKPVFLFLNVVFLALSFGTSARLTLLLVILSR